MRGIRFCVVNFGREMINIYNRMDKNVEIIEKKERKGVNFG